MKGESQVRRTQSRCFSWRLYHQGKRRELSVA